MIDSEFFRKVFVGETLVTNGSAVQALQQNASPLPIGFYDAKTNLNVADLTTIGTKPWYVAQKSIFSKDAVSQFHTGYTGTSKSKYVNPRYLTKVYLVKAKAASQPILHIGSTPLTAGGSCNMTFYCGQPYSLGIRIEGQSVTNFLKHPIYKSFLANTGCCDGGAQVNPVDNTSEIYRIWAEAIASDNYTKDFVKPIVVTSNNTYYTADGRAVTITSLAGLVNGGTFDNLKAAPTNIAGMVLVGAYVDTKFGNCSWHPRDGVVNDPIRIQASLEDWAGNPCYEDLCQVYESKGSAQVGSGEQVIRDFQTAMNYKGNFFESDARMRDAMQGDSLFRAVERNASYDTLFIEHVVPRLMNPSTSFDSDQYLIQISAETGANSVAVQMYEALKAYVHGLNATVEIFKVDDNGMTDESEEPAPIVP